LLYQVVKTYNEALDLYQNTLTDQQKQESTLTAAKILLRWANSQLQDAQNKSREADFRVGRARYIIIRSGFGDILTRTAHPSPGLQTVALNGKLPIYFYHFFIYLITLRLDSFSVISTNGDMCFSIKLD